MTIGWKRGVYPVRRTAEESIRRGDMFVLEDGQILGAGIINQIQVECYRNAPWEFETEDVCVLHTLVISPDAAGRGYGKAFVRFYERWAEEQGLYELRIDTNARNTAARSMYRKLGYKEIATVPTVFNGIEGVELETGGGEVKGSQKGRFSLTYRAIRLGKSRRTVPFDSPCHAFFAVFPR